MVAAPLPLRSRLAEPAILARWPRGLRPTRVFASPHGLELVYEGPDGRRYDLELRPGAPPRVAARTTVQDPTTRRLVAAVARQARSTPGLSAWIDRVTTVMSSDAARGVGDFFQRVTHGQAEAPELGLPAALERVRPFVGPALAPLDFLLGLAHETSGDAALGEGVSQSPGAALGLAFLRRLSGRPVHAEHALRDAADRVFTDDERTELANLLQRWGEPELIGCTLDGAFVARSQDFRAIRLAVVGLLAGDSPAADVQRALARLESLARGAAQRLALAEATLDAGDFEGAAGALVSVVETGDTAQRREARRRLATLALWAMRLDEAMRWVGELLAEVPDDGVGLRIRGAVHLLRHDAARAKHDLEAALGVDEADSETKMWLSHALHELGQTDAARAMVQAVGYGDFPVWQICRARIQHTPGEEPTPKTWFIIRHNLRQILGPDVPLTQRRGDAGSLPLLDEAIRRFGGNRTKRLTLLDEDGSLRWADARSPRHHAEQLQLELARKPVDQVLGAFLDLESRFPEVPFYGTYAAEILMWMGEYERALEHFERLWRDHTTRWGYVGAGACYAMLGRDQRALALFDQGAKHYAFLDAEATYCYRAEVHMRAGRLSEARDDLDLVVRARPTRVGGWVVRALLGFETGEPELAAPARARLLELCPAFCAIVEAHAPWTSDPAGQARFFGHFLERLRGNRSSTMFTMFDDAGEFCVIPTTPRAVVEDWARACISFTQDAVLRALVELELAGP